MGPAISRSVLLGALFFFVPVAQAQVTEAEAHVLSAFTTTADPGVFADNVRVGPELRRDVGPDPEPRELYQAIASLTAGRMLRVQLAPPAEAARYRAIPGVNPTDAFVTLETGELRFLFQYALKHKRVGFVEQLAGEGLPRLAQRKRPALAGKPPPVAAVVPRTPSTSFDGPIGIDPGTPRGECVVKPIMTAMDLYNCSGPTPPAAAPVDLPPPAAVAVTKPSPVPDAPRARGECVIKPVMTDEDLRNCVGVTASVPPVFPAATSTPSAPTPGVARPECLIKPVMTDEELRTCAALAKSTPSVPPVPTVSYQSPAAAPPVPATSPARADCVIKPVMSDEDLRNCASVPRSAQIPVIPAVVQKPEPPAPAAPKPRPDCVIKPVMTDADLRACGAQR